MTVQVQVPHEHLHLYWHLFRKIFVNKLHLHCVRFQVLMAASMKMTAFLHIAPCFLVGVDPTFQRCVLPPSSGWRRQYAPLKCRSETKWCNIPEGSYHRTFMLPKTDIYLIFWKIKTVGSKTNWSCHDTCKEGEFETQYLALFTMFLIKSVTSDYINNKQFLSSLSLFHNNNHEICSPEKLQIKLKASFLISTLIRSWCTDVINIKKVTYLYWLHLVSYHFSHMTSYSPGNDQKVIIVGTST
jgi:hypothetical protein